MTEIQFTPTLTILSDDARQAIHEAALTILKDIGMKILHPVALERLRSAGCEVENENVVKIPSDLVLQSVDSAPNNIEIYFIFNLVGKIKNFFENFFSIFL